MNRGTKTVPEVLPEFKHVMDMGYGQSKLVGEHICANAAKKTPITARILRVGQIVGDTKYGRWNPKEAVPLTAQSACITVVTFAVISRKISPDSPKVSSLRSVGKATIFFSWESESAPR